MRRHFQVPTKARSCCAIQTAYALCIAGWSLGCGAHDTGPEIYPVSGKVSYQGKPVPGAYVMFHADKGGLNASALTDDKGAFVAKTYFSSGQEQRDGMVAGKYQVTVTKQDIESIKSTLSPPKNLLPNAYATPESSPLSAVVEASSDNSYDFILN